MTGDRQAAWKARARSQAKVIRDVISRPVGSMVAVRTSAPVVALTFDDGPDPEVTRRLLGVLRDNNATATFFVLLTRVRLYPEIVAEVIGAGHEIALHGLDHRRLTSLASGELYPRAASARAELEDIAGSSVRWFRPPYGAQNFPAWRAARRAGMTSVFWGPSMWDWKDASREERLARALAGARPGSIILAHDGLADERDGVTSVVPPHLDRAAWAGEVISHYSRRGLRCASLQDVVSTGAPVMAARFVR